MKRGPALHCAVAYAGVLVTLFGVMALLIVDSWCRPDIETLSLSLNLVQAPINFPMDYVENQVCHASDDESVIKYPSQ